MSKFIRGFAGVLAIAVVNLLLNYIVAVTQNQPFIRQLASPLGIGILVILVLVGLVIGVVIKKSNQPASSQASIPQIPNQAAPSPSPTSQNPTGITLSGSKLFGTITKLRGKGIQMDNVTSIGSKQDVDTTQ